MNQTAFIHSHTSTKQLLAVTRFNIRTFYLQHQGSGKSPPSMSSSMGPHPTAEEPGHCKYGHNRDSHIRRSTAANLQAYGRCFGSRFPSVPCPIERRYFAISQSRSTRGNFEVQLPPADLVGQAANETWRIGAIQYRDQLPMDVFGDFCLRNVYAIFDYDRVDGGPPRLGVVHRGALVPVNTILSPITDAPTTGGGQPKRSGAEKLAGNTFGLAVFAGMVTVSFCEF